MDTSAEKVGNGLAILFYIASGAWIIWAGFYAIGVATIQPSYPAFWFLLAVWSFAFLLRELRNVLNTLLPALVAEATEQALITQLRKLDESLPVELTEDQYEEIQNFVDSEPQGRA